MANKISEQLFEAMDVLIGKRILDVEKDKTILCTIDDTTNASKGEYTVSNASARFTAYSENTKYRVGQNVWVLIPNGDYNNDKLIISKYAQDATQPYLYINPMDTFVDMTGNVLAKSAEEIGLLANCDYPISIFPNEDNVLRHLTDENGNTRLGLTDHEEIKPILINNLNIRSDLVTADGSNLKDSIEIGGYDKIGISADFKTAFTGGEPISGTYGLIFVLRTEKDEEVYTLPLSLDSSKMWGNPYGYYDYFTQTAVFDLDCENNGTPTGIDCYFYQNFDFIGENGELIPYYGKVNYGGEDETIDYLPENIFVKDISVSFGYSIDDVETDTLRLFAKNGNSYIVDNEDHPKDLYLRYIYVNDDASVKIAINNINTFEDYAAQIPEFKETMPIIRWYRYNAKDNTDVRAGDSWVELFPDDPFNLTVNDLTDPQSESFKCLLCSNNQTLYYLKSVLVGLPEGDKKNYYQKWYNLYKQFTDEEIATNEEDVENLIQEKLNAYQEELNEYDLTPEEKAQALAEKESELREQYQSHLMADEEWAYTDTILSSNVLVLRNKDASYDTSLDGVQGLRLEPADQYNGIFNLYEASLSADNRLIDSSEEIKPKKIKATFVSVKEDKGINEVERLAWYIPKENTMIKPPIDGKNYNSYISIPIEAVEYEKGKFYTYNNNNNYSISNDDFNADTQYYVKSAENCFRNKTNIDNYKNEHTLSDEEYELFLANIDEYYILLEDNVAEKNGKTQASYLTYFIKPRLVKNWNNNTIKASAYRHKTIYQGERAQFTPTFNVKGANGTDYSLLITTPREFYGTNGSAEATWKEANYPSSWTFNNSDDSTQAIELKATLFDPNDKIVNDVVFSWNLYYCKPSGSFVSIASKNIQGNDGTWLSLNAYNYTTDYLGMIVQCTATIKGSYVFTSYLIIPVRNDRSIEGLQGPTIVRYNSAGTSPQYFNEVYGFIDFEGNIDYILNSEGDSAEAYTAYTDASANKYLPELVIHYHDGRYMLKPQAMYFADVDYSYAILFKKGEKTWGQPILILTDPFGNKLLNSWNGDLVVDKANNRIMSAIIGAGKKEPDNSFTGLLAGDLPKVENVKKTGILGYEHGEQSYGLFDDGTMFLGKSSKAQIRLDGSNGYIKNTGWDSGHGIYIDFDGALNGTNRTDPFINLKSDTGAEVNIGTSTPYFQIKSKNGNNLINVADDGYYLQTDNYSLINQTGLKIDLQNGSFDSQGKLTIKGDRNSNINFGDGNLIINGNGSLTAGEFNFYKYDDEGNRSIAASGIKPKWMTFVTDISGTVERGTAPVTVSGSVPYSYSYPVTTTTTLTGVISASSSSGIATIYGSTVQSTGTSVNIGNAISDEGGRAWATVSVTGAINGTRNVTQNVNVTYSGSTSVPVVTSIKLKISKVSMWALTNNDAEESTVTIS